ncbi:MAG: ATP synthase F1 subunit delta, partial [Ktedonobacterales bacterium]
QPDSLKFALLLAKRNLVGLAPRVREEFDRLYDDYRGQAQAQVTTAMPLDDEMRVRIAADLQAITGKRIILQERLDPSILGGVIARVGDTLVDGSVRRKLQLLREQIRQGGFGGPNDGLDGFTDLPIIPDLGPVGGAPFVVAPGEGVQGGGSVNGGSADGGKPASPSSDGPTSATEMAPRSGSAGGSVHVAPRSNGQPTTGQRQGGQGNHSNKRNNKGRRR